MIKRFFTRFVPLALLAVSSLNNLHAQVITTTYTSPAGRTVVGVAAPQFITFAVTNNNPCPIAITEMSSWCIGGPITLNWGSGTTQFSQNGASYTLWYQTPYAGGGPNISLTNGWKIAGSSAPINVGASTGQLTKIIQGMNLVVPPGQTYRLALASTDTLIGFLTPTPASFTNNGVTLRSYDGANAYLGTMPGPGANFGIGFDGEIVFTLAGQTPPAPPVVVATKTIVCKNDQSILKVTVPSYITNPTLRFYNPNGKLHQTGSNPNDTLNFGTDPDAIGGTWSVEIIDPNCGGAASQRSTLDITVVDPPAPKVDGKTQYCLNEPFTPVTVLGSNPKWYYTDNGGSPIPFTPSFNTTTAHKDIFYVSQTISGCESGTRTMVVYSAAPKPAPPITTTPIYYCENAPAFPLSATGENIKWWYEPTGGLASTIAPTPNTTAKDTFNYWVSQTKDGCESSRIPVNVIITFKPNGLILISKRELCQKDTITFDYYGSAFPGSAYNWTFPPGTELLGGDFRGPLFVKLDSAGLQQVKLQVGNSNCYSDLLHQTIVVDTLPDAKINVRPNICLGQTEIVSLSSYTLSTDSFIWDFNGGYPTHYATDQGPYGIVWDYPGTMKITLKLKNKLCWNTIVDSTVVRQRPDASFKADGYADGMQICVGDSLLMTPNSIMNNGTYSWTPARFFNNASKQAVTHARVDFSGWIKLNVTDAYGCMNADSMYMNTKSCCQVYLPSAFSPNNDGLNDKFRLVPTSARSPQGVERSIEMRTLKVTNRWGQVVYETASPYGQWDGTLNGKPQDAGTYFYYISYKCDGKITEQKGEVMLVR